MECAIVFQQCILIPAPNRLLHSCKLTANPSESYWFHALGRLLDEWDLHEHPQLKDVNNIFSRVMHDTNATVSLESNETLDRQLKQSFTHWRPRDTQLRSEISNRIHRSRR
jgi:hypothetical protein